MKVSDIPASMHYAVITSAVEYHDDTYGGTVPVDVLNYKVMNYDELIPWIERYGRDISYKILEVYPMNVSTTVRIGTSKWSDND